MRDMCSASFASSRCIASCVSKHLPHFCKANQTLSITLCMQDLMLMIGLHACSMAHLASLCILAVR